MMHFLNLPWQKARNHLPRIRGVVTCLFLCLPLLSTSFAQNSCSELFFSEYVEGSGSSNKALEIFNPSTEDIDLANYTVRIYRNGSSESTVDFQLEGTIEAGGVFVVCNNNAGFENCDIGGGGVATFNGDDALALFNSVTESIVDQIGAIGEDPGSSWDVGEGSTSNNTLVRMSTITEGTTDWSLGATQWMVLEIDDVSGLGSHEFDTSACSDTSSCAADAGSLVANALDTCFLDAPLMISATPSGDAVVPDGYSTLFVLTQGSDLVIQNVGEEPSFEVEAEGIFTIHTLVYVADSASEDFLDLSVVELGATTGGDVLNLIEQNDICADLDAVGAPIEVISCTADDCEADAGTLAANPFDDKDCLESAEDSITISATPNEDAVIPTGYITAYVLTSTDSLVIQDTNAEPVFTVQDTGLYTIHTLVYVSNPEINDFLDLSGIVPGETTGSDVLDLIKEQGICASLDVAGAPFMIGLCETDTATCEADAGTLTGIELTEDDCIDLEDTLSTVAISALPVGDAVVPEGYTSIFVLTATDSLVIEAVSDTSAFSVVDTGLYTIHTLVYSDDTTSEDFLDLGVVEFGKTTGGEILELIASQAICASLDAEGLSFNVMACDTDTTMADTCEADAGTLTAVELTDEDCIDTADSASVVTISATPDGNVNIPEGYTSIFVLTSTDSLVIEEVADTPLFEVAEAGLYTIHTLVYSADTASEDFLDLDVVSFGETTGGDVIALIQEADICASLDATGATFEVTECEDITPAPNGIFFSEYVEGSSSNKALEIYNATGEDVDLSNYTIQTFINGNTDPRFEFTPMGTLAAGDVFVICNNNFSAQENCDTTATVASFNGDDAIALYNNTNGDTLDIIGVIGEDPGSEWEVVDGTTQDHTIIRYPEIMMGNTDWTTAQDEWFALPIDEFDSLGFHTVGMRDTTMADTCEAAAGTLTAVELTDEDCIDAADSASVVTISATPDGNINIPDGYTSIFVLTSTDSLVIEAVADTPAFDVMETGVYTIHTLVYTDDTTSEDFLDLSIVSF